MFKLEMCIMLLLYMGTLRYAVSVVVIKHLVEKYNVSVYSLAFWSHITTKPKACECAGKQQHIKTTV